MAGATLVDVMQIAAAAGIVVGLFLAVAGVALGAVGLMSMGDGTIVILGRLVVFMVAFVVVGFSAVTLRRTRQRQRG
jgi:hypothetical protein